MSHFAPLPQQLPSNHRRPKNVWKFRALQARVAAYCLHVYNHVYNMAFVNSERLLAKSRVDITLCQHGKFPATFPLKFFVLYYTVAQTRHNKKHFHVLDFHVLDFHVLHFHVLHFHVLHFYVLHFHVLDFHVLDFHVLHFHVLHFHVLHFQVLHFHVSIFNFHVSTLNFDVSREMLDIRYEYSSSNCK